MLSESMDPVYTIDGVDTRTQRHGTSSKDETVLFKTTFTNTTDREQEYSFKTERATRSAATVIVEKGVCRYAGAFRFRGCLYAENPPPLPGE